MAQPYSTNNIYSYPLHVSPLLLGHLQVVYTLKINHLNYHAIHYSNLTQVPCSMDNAYEQGIHVLFECTE
jgi:hypothetical protein